MTRFTVLAGLAVACTFILVIVGAVVRATASGLGCPDWPTCHGSWIPPFDDSHAIIEWSHRTTAAITGLAVVALAVDAVATQRHRPSLLWPSLVAVALLFFQAWLGKVTVESELSGDIVTAHIATAAAILALLVFVFERSRYPGEWPAGGWDRVTIGGLVTVAGTYAVLLLGAHVRATGTSLAFPDWPLMDGALLSVSDPAALPHAVHRWSAALLAIPVGLFAVWASATNGPAGRLAWTAAAVYLLQVVVGGLQVLTALAPWTQVLHVALGIGAFGLLLAAWLTAWYGPAPAFGEAAA